MCMLVRMLTKLLIFSPKKYTEILDKMAPINKFQVRTKYASWVSDNTKKLITARDAAQLAAATTHE